MIYIIDFGSQVTKLIARRIREFAVFSQIIPYHQLNKKNFHLKNVKGIIFSGGPNSVDEKYAPKVPKFIYDLKIPILGICYGLQLIAKLFGGKIKSSEKRREFGRAIIFKKKNSQLTKNFFNSKKAVWMSHEDAVVKLPKSFKKIESLKNTNFITLYI